MAQPIGNFIDVYNNDGSTWIIYDDCSYRHSAWSNKKLNSTIKLHNDGMELFHPGDSGPIPLQLNTMLQHELHFYSNVRRIYDAYVLENTLLK